MKDTGQLLVEVLVAVTLVVLVLVAAVNVTTKSARNTRVLGDKLEATRFAEIKLDEVLIDKEVEVEDFFDNQRSDGSCGTYGTDDEYSCEIDYQYNEVVDADRVEVVVTISWLEGDQTYEVAINKVFTKQIF